MCAWQSTRPGITYIPAASISFTPLAGRPDSLIATLGKPTLLTSLIRLFSMTMSTGPIGGAPAPSIIVAPRMTSRSNGPSPSPGLRSGPGWIERCGGCVCAKAMTQTRANIETTSHDVCDGRDIAVLLFVFTVYVHCMVSRAKDVLFCAWRQEREKTIAGRKFLLPPPYLFPPPR